MATQSARPAHALPSFVPARSAKWRRRSAFGVLKVSVPASTLQNRASDRFGTGPHGPPGKSQSHTFLPSTAVSPQTPGWPWYPRPAGFWARNPTAAFIKSAIFYCSEPISGVRMGAFRLRWGFGVFRNDLKRQQRQLSRRYYEGGSWESWYLETAPAKQKSNY